MSVGRETLIWAVLFAAVGFALYVLGATVTPFAAGLVLGYLLDPVVNRLERIGLSRLGASLLILVVFAAVSVLVLILLAPILAEQLVNFAAQLPDYAMRLQQLALEEGNAVIEKYGHGWISAFGLNEQQVRQSIGDFVAQGAQWLVKALRSLISDGAAVFGFFSLLIITPVVAFYILIDWQRMLDEIDSWLPLDHRDRLRAIARDINHALSGFIRGQSLVALFLGLWYGIGLTLVGLDYGLLIGVIGGFLSFIPYLGSLTVLVLSVGISLVQGWPGFTLFFSAVAVVVFGQFLEGYVITPKLVGESVGLHPVWLMFALIAFGKLFGFVGLLVAVPMAAAIGVVARHMIALYLMSPLYRGHAPEEP